YRKANGPASRGGGRRERVRKKLVSGTNFRDEQQWGQIRFPRKLVPDTNFFWTPISFAESARDDLHLVEHRPVLARDDQPLRRRVVRDAVQHVLGAALRGRIDARRIDPPDDLAVVGIDARDPILVPDVRPDLAVHPLELVQPDDGPPLGAHAYRADDLERLGIEERNPLGSVAHDEPLAVRREPPALARVAERADPLERPDVV